MQPPTPDRAPTVLILGGLQTLARPLTLYLSEPTSDGKPRAAFIRIVDRFSVSPPSTYLDQPFAKLLAENAERVSRTRDGEESAAVAVTVDVAEGTTEVNESTGDESRKKVPVPIEYKQANLSLVARHEDIFHPPGTWNGAERDWAKRGFEVVYDLTGEMGFDRPELMQIQNTHALSLSLARLARSLPLERQPKAYVRLTYSFYEMKSVSSSSSSGPSSSSSAAAGSSGGHAEGSEAMRPDGVRGRWWHETLRGLASLRESPGEGQQGLNVGAVQAAAWYGPGSWGGEVAPRVVVGHVYQFLKEDMKFLYNSDLRINTIHTTDISQLLYLTSLYLLAHPLSSPASSGSGPRGEAIPESDLVPIPFSFSPPSASSFSLKSFGMGMGMGKSAERDPKRSSVGDAWKTTPDVVPETKTVRMPLFHAVDDGDSTQGEIGRAVGEVWGIKVGYLDSTVASLVQSFAKTAFTDMVDDVNEKHVEAWSNMLAASRPPIDNTPITPFLEEHAFRKLAISLDGSRARKLLGFKPAYPKIQVEELKRIVQGFQQDGIW